MSTLQTLTTEITDLIKVAANDQRATVVAIGAKVNDYVLEYAAKVDDPVKLKQARLKAVKVLAEDVAKAAPRQTFDIHRAYQIWGVTQVYGVASKAWSYSVLKEIAPTIAFDGEWKMKKEIKQAKVETAINKPGESQVTVVEARKVVAGLVEKRKSPAKPPAVISTQPVKVMPPAPEPVRDVAKPAEQKPAVKKEPPAKADFSKEGLQSTIRSGTIAADALANLRYAPDREYAFQEFGKNLNRDEIVHIVKAISTFEESWTWLKQACKAEHAAREKK